MVRAKGLLLHLHFKTHLFGLHSNPTACGRRRHPSISHPSTVSGRSQLCPRKDQLSPLGTGLPPTSSFRTTQKPKEPLCLNSVGGKLQLRIPCLQTAVRVMHSLVYKAIPIRATGKHHSFIDNAKKSGPDPYPNKLVTINRMALSSEPHCL